ncbi:hypothetical protein D3C85_1343930 [compost metagenome]
MRMWRRRKRSSALLVRSSFSSFSGSIIFRPVNSRKAPNTYRIQLNSFTSAAPRNTITVRSTMAPNTPYSSTRRWYSTGTLKKPKISRNTKMLSTASDFSIT